MQLSHPFNASELTGKKREHLKAFKENEDHYFCKTFFSLIRVCGVNKYYSRINQL